MSACAQSAMARKPTTSSHQLGARALQRSAVKSACECKECTKKAGVLQRAAVQEHAPAEVPDIVYDVLKSPGQPLDRGTREFMEQRFNHDFSTVRVHTDARAAESARAVNARAYTVGGHIAFSESAYEPIGFEGRRLLAHELAHVTQYNHDDLATESLVIDGARTREAEDEARAAAENVSIGDDFRTRARITGGAFTLRQAATDLLSASSRMQVGASGRSGLRLVSGSAAPELRTVARGAGAELRLVAKVTEKAAAKRVESAALKSLLKVLSKRYGVVIASSLVTNTVPLIGQLLELGFAAWMVWDMIQVWDSLVEEAAALREESSQEEQGVEREESALPTESPSVDEDEETPERKECKSKYDLVPMNCYADLSDREKVVSDFLIRRYGPGAKAVGHWEKYTPKNLDSRLGISDCEGAGGKAWHRQVRIQSLGGKPKVVEPDVSVFECECCDRKGKDGKNYRATHFSGKT
ncbi:DUF4157 domain-containing protein [Bradyrhizobium sp. JYMT SZCCT0180]|uniref:eCIS core domain-containing protein n=1 Tax=Bradyrhizobium sp. JYMT SZCCT0180 TaxID=2807666 RepID=UPI001BA65650|nr:DUF4157 domain-containing protein [Bradyrhizobium sp. JYMT SZCCT0180]MBR1214646.1 DUF4157 domain-containing protein [Bradyrhizobium sp. JYMT SZCCT0180]